MQRVLVAALAAVDALVAAAAGLAAILAPLTLVWLAALAGDPSWGALWPATARIWQLGQLVPLHVDLDADALLATGLPADAASFWVGLAPLAFAAFSMLFAARSGRRAARSGATLIGWASGAATTAAVAAIVQATSAAPLVEVAAWQAILLPTAVYAAGLVAGGIAGAWEDGDGGAVDAFHDLVDRLPAAWREAPAAAIRGASIVVVGVVGVAGLLFALLVVLRGGEMIVLFERARVDVAGATALTLAHLAYLPTVLGWGVAWIAGPGFALGEGTTVSAAGTTLGVVPGVPLLGLVPEGSSTWMLAVVLVPIALGAVGGWCARRAMIEPAVAAGEAAEPMLPRVAAAGGIAVAAGAAGALIAACASGAFGPGRMAVVGPDPGAVALSLGLEALAGAAIALLSPLGRRAQAPVAADGDDEPLD
ncbi:cell division protein PerM [Microbacterium sp. gxy059]|uniref:cell division protein PerM n=1 Tax=Microbacterium sp. gxy059 TaxID=2957199 RepID=UPI003D98F379